MRSKAVPRSRRTCRRSPASLHADVVCLERTAGTGRNRYPGGCHDSVGRESPRPRHLRRPLHADRPVGLTPAEEARPALTSACKRPDNRDQFAWIDRLGYMHVVARLQDSNAILSPREGC